MMTGVFIELPFPGNTTCPSACLQQQFQQQQFQRL